MLALLNMSQQDMLSSPANIMQLMDWRLTQTQQGMFHHLNGMKNSIDEKLGTLDDRLCTFFEKNRVLEESVQTNRGSIEDLHEGNRLILDRLDRVERKLEAFEQSTKACNVKFVNVEEIEWEDEKVTTEYIVDVLNAHAQTPFWRLSDISRAYRVGKPHPWRKEPRPIIVHFCRWADKMAVMGDRTLRDSLRGSGIKVSSDLTVHQRETVDFHREQGKVAYFHHGKLHVRDREYNTDRKQQDNPWEENWPAAADTRRRHGGGAESHLSDSPQGRARTGRQFGHQDHRPRNSQTRTWGEAARKNSSFLFHQRMAPRRQVMEEGRGCNQSTGNHHDASNTTLRPHNSKTLGVPIIPGPYSYSEVVSHEREGEKTKRTVFLKGTYGRTPASTSQQNREQKVTTSSGPSNITNDSQGRQDTHDVSCGLVNKGRPFSDSNGITEEEYTEDLGNDSDTEENVEGDSDRATHDHIVAENDGLLDTEAPIETNITTDATPSTNEVGQTEITSEDENMHLAKPTVKEAVNSSSRIVSGQKQKTVRQTNKHTANNTRKSTMEQRRQSLTGAQAPRPRRTASQPNSDDQGQGRVRPATRSASQTRISDVFKKTPTGNRVDPTPQAATKAKTIGAPDTNK